MLQRALLFIAIASIAGLTAAVAGGPLRGVAQSTTCVFAVMSAVAVILAMARRPH